MSDLIKRFFESTLFQLVRFTTENFQMKSPICRWLFTACYHFIFFISDKNKQPKMKKNRREFWKKWREKKKMCVHFVFGARFRIDSLILKFHMQFSHQLFIRFCNNNLHIHTAHRKITYTQWFDGIRCGFDFLHFIISILKGKCVLFSI